MSFDVLSPKSGIPTAERPVLESAGRHPRLKFADLGAAPIGFNAYSQLYMNLLGSRTAAQMDTLFNYIAGTGAKLVRIMFPAFSGAELTTLVHPSNPTLPITDASFRASWLTASDLVFDRAAAAGLKVVACLFWTPNAVPTMVGATYPAAYASTTSTTVEYMASFARWFAGRYKDHAAMGIYSFGNEYPWADDGVAHPTAAQLGAVFQKVGDALRDVDTTHLTMVDLPGVYQGTLPTRMSVQTYIDRVRTICAGVDVWGPHFYIATGLTGRKSNDGAAFTAGAANGNGIGYEDLDVLVSEVNAAAEAAGKLLYIGEFGVANNEETDTLTVVKERAVRAVSENCLGGMLWDVNFAAGAAANQAIWLIEPTSARATAFASVVTAANRGGKAALPMDIKGAASGEAKRANRPDVADTSVFTRSATGRATFRSTPDMSGQSLAIAFWLRADAALNAFERVVTLQNNGATTSGVAILADGSGAELYADWRGPTAGAGNTIGTLPPIVVGEWNHYTFLRRMVNGTMAHEVWFNGHCWKSVAVSATYAGVPTASLCSFGGGATSGAPVSMAGFTVTGDLTVDEIHELLRGTAPADAYVSQADGFPRISYGASVTGVRTSGAAGSTVGWDEQVADAYRLMVPGRQYATSGVPRDVSGLGNHGALVPGMTDAELWGTDNWMRSIAGSTKSYTFGVGATTFDLGSQSVLVSFEMIAPTVAATLIRNISGIGASQGFSVGITATGLLQVALRTSGGGATLANTPAVFADTNVHHFALGIDGPNRTVTVWYDGTPCLSLSAAFPAGTTAPTGDLTFAALDPGGVGTTYDLLARGLHYMVFDGGLPINVNYMVLRMAQAPGVPLLNRDVKVV